MNSLGSCLDKIPVTSYNAPIISMQEEKPVTQKPLVSVIVPVWNGAAYLEACLKSISVQTVTDMEIIVVDDGSTDQTWSLLERLAQEDVRIIPVHQENAGVSEARNAGLERSRGEYIRFVDVDDTLPPESMAALVEKAQANGSDLVLGAYTEVLLNSRSPRDLGRSEETVDNDEFLRRLERYSNSFYYGVLWNKLFRGDIARDKQVRFVPGLPWGEDFAFVMRYCAHAERISYTTAQVYDYFRNPKGAVMRQAWRSIQHPIRAIKDRWLVYTFYCELFRSRGRYEEYRHVLWKYLFRVALRS